MGESTRSRFCNRNGCFRRRVASVFVCSWLISACGVATGGGGGVAVVSAGSTCNPVMQGEICGTSAGAAAVLHCDAAARAWLLVAQCGAGEVCKATATQLICAPAAVGADASADSDAQVADAPDSADAVADLSADQVSVEDAISDVALQDIPPADSIEDVILEDLKDSFVPPDSKSDIGVKDGKADSVDVFVWDSGKPDIAKDTGPSCNCQSEEKCDFATATCYIPCGGSCKSGQACIDDNPPGFCQNVFLPSSWGVNGDGMVQKVSALSIATAVDGCDLNGDGKPDNKVSSLTSMMGSSLADSVKKGTTVVLLEPLSFASNGSPFTFQVLYGGIDPSDTGHDPTTAGGLYTVNSSSYVLKDCTGGSCPATTVYTDAQIDWSGSLTASGTSGPFNLNMGGGVFSILLQDLSFSGQVSGTSSWNSTTGGKLCGYFLSSDLVKAISGVPDSTFAGIGMTKTTVLQLIPSVLSPDLDTDGDGTKDAISFAVNAETVSGTVTGITP